ncbi:S-formylglutathione hydrolase [Zea mays]|nr:hypothetical protein Zm00014a_037052 [Zea mays]PWZ33924.1 S-formylglutathione hydrolase [Zea mays]
MTATCLIKKNSKVSTPILIDQGQSDKFLAEQQLLPRNFEEACKSVGATLTLRMQPGYDRSHCAPLSVSQEPLTAELSFCEMCRVRKTRRGRAPWFRRRLFAQPIPTVFSCLPA